MSDAPSSRHLTRYGIGLGILALIVLVTGIATRVSADHSLKAIAEENSIPGVSLVRIARTDDGQDLVLPGTLQAFNSAALYARTNGYVRRWLADNPPTAMRCERGSAFAPGSDCIAGYSCPPRQAR